MNPFKKFYNIDDIYLERIAVNVALPKAHITNIKTNHKYLIIYYREENVFKIIDLYTTKYKTLIIEYDELINNLLNYIT